nr:reverse transcriptase domain-containing protein [Tanacetum cinerariifolium]
MSVMANTTPLVTTVTKPATNLRDADATPRVNIQEFCEEYYEDILSIIMEKVRRDRRKNVHTRLDFGEGPRERTREDSHHSSVRARTTKPERLKVQDRLRYGDRLVLDQLGRSRPHRLDTSHEDRPKDRERFRSVEESCDDSFSHSYRDENRSRHMKRRRDNESPPSNVSKSDSNDESTPGVFHATKKYVKYLVEIHNIKQKDGETIEDFMERFKVETRRMKGDPECMRISGFMHGVNNPELTKRLNKHVPKTMEEMMITTTAFIRGEAAAASKKKGHASWKAHDQSKRQNSDKSSDFRGYSREGKGSNWFTPLTRTPKEILAVEVGKFQPPPPMVTSVEKRSSNKFCDFHNDKGHSTDECMQLKKQIEELVRAGKLSHLMKGIKHGRDQSKTRKKETTAKDKPTAIYMIQSWQRTTRQKPEIKSQMVPATTSLTGFSSETIWPLGQLRLLVIIGDANHSTRAWMNFMIVRLFSPYNGIIGRPGIREIQAVPSTVHGMLKFPEERTRLDNFKVALHLDFPDQELAIGGTLSDKGRTELCSILKKNLVIFAWQPSDMTGVSRSIAEHRLNIREGYLPVRQKKRGLAPERAKAIQVEVQKLVETEIMREVYYHDFLSNLVKVKKHDGSWQMCVDFTDLNKACPQDRYPILEIDWKVESLCGYPFKCFLDAYKGYHQIQLAEPDKEKTAFHTG